MLRQCKGKTRSGSKCRNHALDGTGYCRRHHPHPIHRPSTGTLFEEKVVKVLKLLGYKVERDVTISGCQIDIYAEYRTGIIPHRLMVECKDYGPGRDVGIEDVNKFVGVLTPARGKVIDKGLFVTTHGFTRHAKEYARDAGIQCVTFAHLSTQLVDFDGYIESIIHDFERSPVAPYYVDLSGTETEDYEGLEAATFHRPLDDLVNQCLQEKEQGKLALLGNFGTGKTTFCRKYTYELAKQYKKDQTGRIPILINLSDYDKKQDIQEVITSALQYGYGIRIDPALCQELQRLGRFVLLFDGFDEMAVQVDPDTIRDNLREINKVSKIPENTFLLTCRTHFFRDRVQAEILTDFDVIYIPEWGRVELVEFLKKRFGHTWQQQLDRIRGTHNLEELAQTPLFLEMIVETLPKLGDQVRRIELYQTYTDKWIKSQSYHRGARLSEDERRQFVSDLAIKLYTEDTLSCHYTEFTGILRKRIQTDDAANIDYLQHDVRTSTFLTRDSNGSYSFRHKSFLEFFVAQALSKEINEAVEDTLGIKLLRMEVAGFLVEFLNLNPPEKILKTWLAESANQVLRDNSLLLLARLGINISDARLEEQSDIAPATKLTAKFVQGDTGAFEEIYKRFRGTLVQYIRHRGLRGVPEYVAEDLVDDVFISLLQRADQLEQITDIERYLITAARYKVNDYLRHHSKEIPLLEEDLLHRIPAPDESNMLEVAEEASLRMRLLEDALKHLTEQERQVLLYSYNEDKKMKIARELNMSTTAVRAIKTRAIRKVRKYIEINR